MLIRMNTNRSENSPKEYGTTFLKVLVDIINHDIEIGISLFK